MRIRRVHVVGCLSSIVAACQQPAVFGPQSFGTYRDGIDSALRSGNPELAEETLQRARLRFADDSDLLAWSAVVERMRWRDQNALNDMRQVHRSGDYGGLGRDEVMGRIGELLFAVGSYAESRPFLMAAAAGADGSPRLALAKLTRDLPRSRREPLQLAAELPLLEGPLPELLCTIGSLERPFVLDTGASFTTLTRSLAAELDVSPILDAGTGRDGAGQTIPVSFGVLANFDLGRARLGDLPVVVVADDDFELRDPFGGPVVKPSGVVGLDVLARFRVTFDPNRRSVIFELPRGLEAAAAVDCIHHEGQCLVPVQIEGRRLWFVLDTGASHSSLTREGLLALPGGMRRTAEAFRRIRSPGGTHHSVRQVSELTMTIAKVRFTGVDLPIVRRPVSPLFPVHGVLGSDLLMRCRTTLDRGRLRLQTL